jgi:hypothetical protein
MLHISSIAHMWKGETSGARKDENLLELEATDAGFGSGRRREHVCWAALAAALSVRAIDARTPERQTRYISVYRLGFRGQASARAIDARARLSGVHRTHLSAWKRSWVFSRQRPSQRQTPRAKPTDASDTDGDDYWNVKLRGHVVLGRASDAETAFVGRDNSPTNLFEGAHLYIFVGRL